MFFFRSVKKKIKKNKILHSLTNLLLLLFAISFVHCILFFLFENVSISEAVWQVWQTITTVGYGNKPAETLNGRLTTIILSTCGIAILGGIFSLSMDIKNYYNERKIFGMFKNKSKNGYVILNFPGEQTAMRLIKEIRASEGNVPICFVDENLESLPKILDDVDYIRGDLLSKDTYERANIEKCKSAIVMPSNSDATTKVLVDLILKCYPNLNVLYILIDENNRWMFDNRATSVLKNFWVLTLVQECQDPHTSSIMEHILSNLHEEDILTVDDNDFSEWKWGDFCKKISDSGYKIKPLALIKNNSVNLFPDYNELIEDGKISFITLKNFTWDNIKKELI